jgi:hypothetical protein
VTAIGKVSLTPATKAKAARTGYSSADGLANAVICIGVMLACVIAVVFLAIR